MTLPLSFPIRRDICFFAIQTKRAAERPWTIRNCVNARNKYQSMDFHNDDNANAFKEKNAQTLDKHKEREREYNKKF